MIEGADERSSKVVNEKNAFQNRKTIFLRLLVDFMTLSALDEQGRLVTIALDENPEVNYGGKTFTCRYCNGKVHPRFRTDYVAHFSHSSEGCSFDFSAYKGRKKESPQHLEAKIKIAKLIKEKLKHYLNFHPVLEVPIQDIWRIADLLCETKCGWAVAHEIQLSSINAEELTQRTLDYWRAGIDVVWWLGKNARNEQALWWCRTIQGYVPLISWDENENNIALSIEQPHLDEITDKTIWIEKKEEDNRLESQNEELCYPLMDSNNSSKNVSIFDKIMTYNLLLKGIGRIVEIWRSMEDEKKWLESLPLATGSGSQGKACFLGRLAPSNGFQRAKGLTIKVNAEVDERIWLRQSFGWYEPFAKQAIQCARKRAFCLLELRKLHNDNFFERRNIIENSGLDAEDIKKQAPDHWHVGIIKNDQNIGRNPISESTKLSQQLRVDWSQGVAIQLAPMIGHEKKLKLIVLGIIKTKNIEINGDPLEWLYWDTKKSHDQQKEIRPRAVMHPFPLSFHWQDSFQTFEILTKILLKDCDYFLNLIGYADAFRNINVKSIMDYANNIERYRHKYYDGAIEMAHNSQKRAEPAITALNELIESLILDRKNPKKNLAIKYLSEFNSILGYAKRDIEICPDANTTIEEFSYLTINKITKIHNKYNYETIQERIRDIKTEWRTIIFCHLIKDSRESLILVLNHIFKTTFKN